MRLILRQFLALGTASAILYAVLLLIALLIYPPSLNLTMDSLAIHDRSGRVFTNSPRYIVWNRHSLRKKSPKFILVGGSNLRAGLRLSNIQKELAGQDVHNMSAGGMNITQMRQIVDLALEVIPLESLKETTFVIALSFALFVDNDHHWRVFERLPGTRVEMEMKRFGLYQWTNHKYEPVLPAHYISKIGLALWPLFTLSSLNVQLSEYWQTLIGGAAPSRKDRDMSRPADQAEAFAMWRTYIGTPDDKLQNEQFEELRKLATTIGESGAHLVIVEMPMPRWFVAQSAHLADYLKRKRPYFREILSKDRTSYIDFSDMDNILDYRDSGHFNESGAIKFSSRLADSLKQLALPSARPHHNE